MSAYSWSVEWARTARIRTLAKLETGSTNTDAKEQLSTLGHRSLVIADHQTSGRGRGDHTWTDSGGQALLSSWIFETAKSPQPIMSALIGLALFNAAKETWPSIEWALRAPNDLHVINAVGSPEKMAGLLIEIVSGGGAGTKVIVGLGVNVNGAPGGTAPFKTTSLLTEVVLKKEALTEEKWNRFLANWLENAESAIAAGTVPELKQSSRSLLQAGLARHPEFRDLREVLADGSLVFEDGRTTPWSKL